MGSYLNSPGSRGAVVLAAVERNRKCRESPFAEPCFVLEYLPA